jgi:hypothetical protein
MTAVMFVTAPVTTWWVVLFGLVLVLPALNQRQRRLVGAFSVAASLSVFLFFASACDFAEFWFCF